MSTKPTLTYEHIKDAAAFLGARKEFPESEFNQVVEAYTSDSRNYHGLEHATRMALGSDSISKNANGELSTAYKLIFPGTEAREVGEARRKLIGFGHDIVYFGVDGNRLPDVAKDRLAKYLDFDHDNPTTFTLKHPNTLTDKNQRALLDIAETMFDFKPGQVIDATQPFKSKGFNEFASALVKMDLLNDLEIPRKELGIVAMATALTVPFVGKDAEGVGYADRLVNRLEGLNTKHFLAILNEDRNQAAALSVDLATQDVLGFAGNMQPTPEGRLKTYLGGSWRLMPEMTPALRKEDITTEQYMGALKGMRGFTRGWLDPNVTALNPDSIFDQITVLMPHNERKVDYPDDATMRKLRENVTEVLTNAASYLDTKLVSAGLVLALAKLAGDDAVKTPLHHLMNGIGNDIQLPRTQVPANGSASELAVSSALAGRTKDNQIHFDSERSPLGEFIYLSTSPQLAGKDRLSAIRDLADAALQMLDNKLPPSEYIGKVQDVIGRHNTRVVVDAVIASAKKHSPDIASQIREGARGAVQLG